MHYAVVTEKNHTAKRLAGIHLFSTQISYTKKLKNLYQDYYTAGVHSDIKRKIGTTILLFPAQNTSAVQSATTKF